jgi:hypothetical protein
MTSFISALAVATSLLAISVPGFASAAPDHFRHCHVRHHHRICR